MVVSIFKYNFTTGFLNFNALLLLKENRLSFVIRPWISSNFKIIVNPVFARSTIMERVGEGGGDLDSEYYTL